MAVSYMNGEQLLTVITNSSAQVAGTSAVDTARALAAESYRLNSGEGGVISFPYSVIQGGTPVSLEAAYAAQMWDYWKITGGAAVSAIGTAAAGAATWAQGVLFGNPELAGTLAGSGGLLTMSLPAAAAAFAPLLGVSLGGALYESNPELWTKFSQAILPFAYDDKDTIAFVVDKLGQVFAPKGAVDAMKQVLDEEGIGPTSQYTSELTTKWNQPIITGGFLRNSTRNEEWSFSGNAAIAASSTRANFAAVFIGESLGEIVTYALYRSSSSQSSLTGTASESYTYDGRTVYYGSVTSSNPGAFDVRSGVNSPYSSNMSNMGPVAWTIKYGTEGGTYPVGTSKWTGNSVDVSQLTPIQVVSGLDGSTTPYIPVTLPVGDPTVTNDPSIQPDPTAPVTAPQLDPYISPVTLPELWPTFPEEVPIIEPGARVGPQVASDPLYVPAPDLYPNNDPTVIGDVQPAEELPTNQSNPISGGQSPDPIFPVPDIQFPSWTPAGSDEPVVSGQPGFIQIYHPSPSEFVSFGRWLWVTYGDATIDKIWNNPFDGVIGAHELYATPEDGGYSTIRCGFLDSGISSQVVNQRYTQINCGSIVIPEYWGNYLDYSPYSQAMIYLPFIGIVNLEVDDIVGAAVNVLYHVDSYTGSCIAQITVAKDDYSNTLYQFAGNCSVEIPMAGGSQAQIKAALMTANAYQNAANVSANLTGLGGLGSGIASAISGLLSGGAIASTGNFAGGMSAGIGGAASGVSQIIHGYTGAKSQQAYGEAQHTANMLSGKAIVQHSGSFGSSHGAMGIKKPYLIIRRPIQKVVNGYQKLYGYPAHKQVIIGSCTGYLRCREVHVVSSLATDAEKNQIESLLKGGVYVTEQ